MKTPLYSHHKAENAKIVDFAGYDMPIHYGSQIQEHHWVRQRAGKFDVSHMGVVDISGADAGSFLDAVCVGGMTDLEPGVAKYTLLLNECGGIIDDLIVYRRNSGFRAVINAAVKETDISWMRSHIGGAAVSLRPRLDLCIVAVQGPDSIAKAIECLDLPEVSDIGPFRSREWSDDLMVSRTGYTGENGVEVICSEDRAIALWLRLSKTGVPSIGLGARDTLRLEAGLNLNGHDMNPSVTPFSANLAWTIDWAPADRAFIGRAALEQARASGVKDKLAGLVLYDRGVMREGNEVNTLEGHGVLTSGSFSPTLGCSIGLARIPRGAKGDCTVSIRSRELAARIIRPPFVRHGKKVYK